jgi:hypothetical protein
VNCFGGNEIWNEEIYLSTWPDVIYGPLGDYPYDTNFWTEMCDCNSVVKKINYWSDLLQLLCSMVYQRRGDVRGRRLTLPDPQNFNSL